MRAPRRRVVPAALLLVLVAACSAGPVEGAPAVEPGAPSTGGCGRATEGAPVAADDGAPTSTRTAAAAVASPFVTGRVWTDPGSQAARAVAQERAAGRAAVAGALLPLATTPTAVWLSDPDSRAARDRAAQVVAAARADRATPVLVVYVIPDRDCGAGASAGGVAGPDAWAAWIDAVADGIAAAGPPPVAVVLEPDALAALADLPEAAAQQRLSMLRAAVVRLQRVPGVAVYLDAGHPRWVPVATMAARLRAAGVDAARGVAVGVSNFLPTDELIGWGRELGTALGRRLPLVLDVSRNGAGPDPQGRWCNPPGRRVGAPPRIAPAAGVDAELWIKPPGESDGGCSPGDPAAGRFSVPLALALLGGRT